MNFASEEAAGRALGPNEAVAYALTEPDEPDAMGAADQPGGHDADNHD